MKRKHNTSKEGYMPEGFYPYSIYDEDSGEKAGRGSIVPATQGCIAAPSTSTKNKFYSEKKLRAEHKRIPQCYALLTMGGLAETLQYTSDLELVTDYHEAMLNLCQWRKSSKPRQKQEPRLEKRIGIYSLKGKRPFITSNQKIKVSDEELVYENENEFAYAVATRALDFYGLLDAKHSKLEDNSELFKKLVKDPEKRMYNLPDQYLAMDILVCNTYCHKELEKYTSKKLISFLIELGAIEHFKVRKRTKENIDKRAEEILLPLKKNLNYD